MEATNVNIGQESLVVRYVLGIVIEQLQLFAGYQAAGNCIIGADHLKFVCDRLKEDTSPSIIKAAVEDLGTIIRGKFSCDVLYETFFQGDKEIYGTGLRIAWTRR